LTMCIKGIKCIKLYHYN